MKTTTFSTKSPNLMWFDDFDNRFYLNSFNCFFLVRDRYGVDPELDEDSSSSESEDEDAEVHLHYWYIHVECYHYELTSLEKSDANLEFCLTI